jgi:hypothetical protein
VGFQKTLQETHDGGRTWAPVANANQPVSNPDFTVYTQIAFTDARRGMILGSVLPPRPGEIPAWLAPQRAAAQRQTPTLMIELETADGGATWKGSTAQLPGAVKSLRTAGSDALTVFGFDQALDFPSEVYHADFATGRNTTVFRQPASRINDSLVFAGHVGFLAGVEPPGRLASLPIPGKVKMFTSTDLTNWRPMDIDFKAVAGSVTLAGPDPDHVWAATDTGMILHLAR